MTTDEKLDAILKRLDRLDLVESHLLDLLIPKRQAYVRHPHPEPPVIVTDALKALAASHEELHAKLDDIAGQVKPAPQTFEEAHAEIVAKPHPITRSLCAGCTSLTVPPVDCPVCVWFDENGRRVAFYCPSPAEPEQPAAEPSGA